MPLHVLCEPGSMAVKSRVANQLDGLKLLLSPGVLAQSLANPVTHDKDV
jgi:hypothetical protein